MSLILTDGWEIAQITLLDGAKNPALINLEDNKPLVSGVPQK